MIINQLELDLHRRCKERTHQLVCDLFSLYDMAGLEEITAAESILTALFMETATLTASLGVESQEAGETLANLVSAIKQRQQHASR